MNRNIAARDDQDPFEDRRATPRVRVALPASLQVGTKRLSVQILDLSAGGAKLNCATEFAAGTSVLLDCGTLACSGVVRWNGGGTLGLCFDAELDPREVTALANRSDALEALMKTRG